MKLASVLSVLGIVLFSSTMALAGDHKTPDAPADFLSKESPIKAEDADEAVLKAGGKIYAKKCAKCHGESGDGKGSAAGEMVIKPTALSAPGYMAGRKDGQLFWMLMNGSPNTEMKAFGPGSDQNYSEDELWQVIAYMRSAFTK